MSGSFRYCAGKSVMGLQAFQLRIIDVAEKGVAVIELETSN